MEITIDIIIYIICMPIAIGIIIDLIEMEKKNERTNKK